MKLETTIAPRRNGTVNVATPDGTGYEFTADDEGRLVAEVENEEHAGWLLSLGTFVPADEADFAQASRLLSDPDPDPEVEDDGDGEDDDDGDADGAADALPVESNTPPAPPKKKKGAAK